jgi:hypothetical protein
MLCVGGPRDGERFSVPRNERGFRAPIIETAKIDDWNARDLQQPVAVASKFVEYREETFHTPQGDVSFWVPEGQTSLQSITMLLEAYESNTK